MQKIINNYVDATFVDTWRNRYMRYRAGHPKHRYYLNNRKQPIAKLDLWDEYILKNLQPGKTIAWDASGYYLQDFVQDLVVVEKYPIVLDWAPDCIIDTDVSAMLKLKGSADNLIFVNINELRWKDINYWTTWWIQKAIYLKPNSQIFFSFRENRLLRNRLKESLTGIMSSWLPAMEQHGFYVKHYSYDPCPIDATVHDHRHAPEIVDTVNGNLKIHWEYHG